MFGGIRKAILEPDGARPIRFVPVAAADSGASVGLPSV